MYQSKVHFIVEPPLISNHMALQNSFCCISLKIQDIHIIFWLNFYGPNFPFGSNANRNIKFRQKYLS